MNKFIDKIENQEGYQLLPKVIEKDYKFICQSIEKQWLKRINKFDSKLADHIQENNINIKDYHCISHNLPHSKLWDKKSRIFEKNTAKKFLNLSFIKDLGNLIGEFDISDEEDLGFENIYWRLVRPLPCIDIGGMHRDEWFWKINHQYKEPEYPYIRRKIWIPIYSEVSKNGLLVKPFSQLDKNIKWCAEKVNGKYKPKLVSEVSESDIKHLKTKDGEMVIFHDRMLHGGSKNFGNKCRISLEFTALIRAD